MSAIVTNQTTVRKLHDRAMRMCDRALASRKAGDVVREHRQLRSTLRSELMAAGLAAEKRVSVLTSLILVRSATKMIERVVDLQNTGGANT